MAAEMRNTFVVVGEPSGQSWPAARDRWTNGGWKAGPPIFPCSHSIIHSAHSHSHSSHATLLPFSTQLHAFTTLWGMRRYNIIQVSSMTSNHILNDNTSLIMYTINQNVQRIINTKATDVTPPPLKKTSPPKKGGLQAGGNCSCDKFKSMTGYITITLASRPLWPKLAPEWHVNSSTAKFTLWQV